MNLNSSPEENYRYHGALPADQIEDLLDGAIRLEAFDAIDGYLTEAKGCYPAEDFLHMELTELREFAKKMRGDNKQDFLGLIERIEEARDEQNRTAEYGAEQIKLALKAIE